jgi:hypothetical protein
MTAIIYQSTKSGNIKTTVGDLLQNGSNTITVVVYGSKGLSSIKRFNKRNILNYVIDK